MLRAQVSPLSWPGSAGRPCGGERVKRKEVEGRTRTPPLCGASSVHGFAWGWETRGTTRALLAGGKGVRTLTVGLCAFASGVPGGRQAHHLCAPLGSHTRGTRLNDGRG